MKDTSKQCDDLQHKCEELTCHSEDAKKSLQAKEEKCKVTPILRLPGYNTHL